MLAYAAHRRPARQVRPATLALIIGAHAAAIALLAAAKMDVLPKPEIVRTEARNIPLPEDPPPPLPKVEPEKQLPSPPQSQLDTPPKVIDIPLDRGPVIIPGPIPDNPGPLIGTNPQPVPFPEPRIEPRPTVKVAAVLATSGDRLKPPYPDSKLRLEEEASLRLRLSIDPRGRVTAVEPVGPADPAFLAAARSHLTRHWRYKPATEDGRAVATTVTITLSFRLEDA